MIGQAGRVRRLTSYLRPYRHLFVVSFLASTAASVLDGFSFTLLIPFLRSLFGNVPQDAEGLAWVERPVDWLVGLLAGEGADVATVLVVSGVLIFLAIALKNVAAYAASYLGVYLEEHIARDIRVEVYERLLRLKLSYFESTKSGQLLSRIVSDVDQLKHVVSHALTSLVRNGILLSVYVAILFSLSVRLTLIALLVAPLVTGMLVPLIGKMRARLRTALNNRGEIVARVNEVITGARLVKSHSGEDYESSHFEAAADEYVDDILGTQRLAVAASPLSETMGAGIIVVLILSASWLASDLRPEIFVTFVALTIRLLPPVKSLAQFPAQAEHALTAAERVFEVLAEETEPADTAGSKPFTTVQNAITFEGVWFRYEDDWVLRDVDLEIRSGSITGIVGPSGAGKSTLVDLIPRFIEPQRGTVAIDGTPLRDFDRTALRAAIGFVSQETVLFHDSVATNIAYGDSTPDMDRIHEVAVVANAHQFVRALPHGYHTMLGERGVRLSGGERQRLAIARALYRDPPILVLDEATAALDSESERLVQEAVERLLENRTVIVIAHRLSTVTRSDQIVVLDRGRIVERGTHPRLVKQEGLYARLHASALDTGVL